MFTGNVFPRVQIVVIETEELDNAYLKKIK